MNALDDPYAAIRRMRFNVTPGQTSEANAGDWSLGGTSPDLYAPDGGWGDFQSKYNYGGALAPDGTLEFTLQNPGMHKYDTLRPRYVQDPATGEWVMQGDPAQTRETSSMNKFQDFAEKAALMAGAVIGGGYGLSAMGGGAAAGLGAGEGLGTLGSIGAGAGAEGGLALSGSLGAADAGLVGLGQAAAGVPSLGAVGGGGIGTLGTIGSGSLGMSPMVSSGLMAMPEIGAAGASLGAGPIGAGAIGGAALGGAAGSAMGGGGSSGSMAPSGAYGASPTASLNGLSAASPSATVSGGGMGGWGNIGNNIANVFTGNGSANTYANLLQGAIGLYGQNKAVGAMEGANSQSNALLRSMYDQNRADNQPLMDLRNQTLPQISSLMQNPQSITSDPGYQFGLNQGQTALDNKAAGAGSYYSGAQMKGAARYNQDYAGTKLDQSLTRLMGVAGLGQVGANNNQQNSNLYGTQASGNALDLGNVRGSGYMANANTMGNALGNAFQDWQYRQLNGRP